MLARFTRPLRQPLDSGGDGVPLPKFESSGFVGLFRSLMDSQRISATFEDRGAGVIHKELAFRKNLPPLGAGQFDPG
ncbi:hypothetical protein [Rhizobium leguminosarum]|uniref:hypothetical protein n=1 Tax=Rhizobium leguminosarum TaxID=384 RepID=UPI001C91A5BE|nr:hypothetical protein [Rhizobium leguminosarum]MBY2918681.1 hypothetical protein [Rhizobium leguminosarum]MBY2973931.1 hypothetical protein [Rhizobium leguminosarum]MBY2981331.1 hypothetical protein [Rhizobium leguminosarum]